MAYAWTARRIAAIAVLTLGAGLLGVGWYLLPPEIVVAAGWWPVFALAVAGGEFLMIENARGRAVPSSFAVLVAYALLGGAPALVASAAASGWLLAAVIRFLAGRENSWSDVLQRAASGWGFAGAVALTASLTPENMLIGAAAAPVDAAAIVVVAAGLILGWPTWEGLESAGAQGVPGEPLVVGMLGASWRTTVSIASSGALAALAYGILGPASLLLMLLPILAARAGLHRYTDVRRTYDQTVRAMSRIAELTGNVDPGHGVRVGELATAVARELGLSDREVEVVERSAYLHEVGRVSTDDPNRSADDRDVALAGAAIVREAGSMPMVAETIERHRDGYRLRHRGQDPSVGMPARVVRTVCDYDRASAPTGPGRNPWDGMEKLHLGMAYDYDPVVIQALTRVLQRRGVL